ncbi:DNA recombination protein RecT [Pullulanibacillus camelliae]|uniref:DNA recombination protein RecT n=1 Tax=Pullulanibacillus camelliae TaxID=1707096 RepID=A0A8J2YK31_9BACL|nr:recombination protein RecT [Pullulanibacillus camelliae]GGE47917.1 DNA recombination protein RecT [Pullulanibacillus camelliae]
MATNQDVKNQLANRQQQAPATNPANTIAAYLKKMGPQIEKALPKHMDPDRMARIALTTIRQTPKLLQCEIPSLLGAVMQAAQLGLEPGLIGHCYIIPYGNQAQFIIGYKGMIDLARRSGHIESIYAQVVYENDEFEYEFGLDPKLVHKPLLDGDRGAFKAAYGVAKYKDGGFHIEVMGKGDIEKIRQRSKASNNGPWKTDYEEMAKKTVIRRMWKYLPISIEIQQQAAQDEVVRKDITEEAKSVYDDDYIDVEISNPQDYENQPEQ